MLVVGLDPGGITQFGWCVAETVNSRVRLRKTDVAYNAAEALDDITEYLGHLNDVEGVAIDSPLFWVANGDRRADQTVRKAMKALGATASDGTVQRVNSLRGACLVQGVMAAHIIRRKNPQVRLTESHPKALLWLLRVASAQRRVTQVGIEQLLEFMESDAADLCEHERDAALGSFAAAAMLQSRRGWRDLAKEETNAFAPVSPVEYWIPVAAEPH